MNATEQLGHERVIALLADHLSRCGMLRWPGMDGMTVEEVVLASCRGGANAGCLPTPAELAERHPALADDIRRYFAGVADLARRAEG
jgi:hypothetical protein